MAKVDFKTLNKNSKTTSVKSFHEEERKAKKLQEVKKAGRPLQTKTARTNQTIVYWSDDEIAKLKEQMIKEGQTLKLSEFIRNKILDIL